MTNWNGRSVWIRSLGTKLLQIGAVTLPERVEWQFTGEGGDPDLAMVFEIRDGRPVCVSVRIDAQNNGRGIRSSDLSALEVDKQTSQSFVRFALHSEYDVDRDVTKVSPIQGERELWAALGDIDEAVAAPSRGVTRAELEQVAKVYLSNVSANPTESVQLALRYKSLRTAQRRVKQAEEAGLLPPTTQGRRRGNGAKR